MRKSGRLASIHEDEPNSSNTTTNSSKKFSPTIPTVRRKKVIEESEELEQISSTVAQDSKTSTRRPLNSRTATHTAPSNVSGPLSLGPASMPRSGISRSSSNFYSSTSIASPATQALSRMSLSSVDSNPLFDSVTIEQEFSNEGVTSDGLIKPVALVDTANNSLAFESFEANKLFLFQMPPILPTLLNHSSNSEEWPSTAQGRYGKLRRYKSGKIVMILENGVEFCVNPSIDFEPQNTSVLAIDPEFAQSFNLGSIKSKFVCTPDFAKFQKLSLHQ